MLGDRSLKLKYLNANTMFLATGSTPEQPGNAHVTAHIFDTITGRLVFSQTHEVSYRVLIPAQGHILDHPAFPLVAGSLPGSSREASCVLRTPSSSTHLGCPM